MQLLEEGPEQSAGKGQGGETHGPVTRQGFE